MWRTWDYGKDNHEAINNAIVNFDWEKAFSNINVRTQVKLFNETLTSIFMNSVSNKLIIVDDRNPPLVTENIKKLLKDKSKFYTQCIKNGREEGDYKKLLNITTNITTEISNSKKNYFDNLTEKLCDPKLNRKAYWSILKSFTNWKKVPIIPPLLINDHFVTKLNEKANYFNEFFVNKCSLINNHSKLPLNRDSVTTSLLSSVSIKESDILSILKSLDTNKAHGHDDISIRMLKLSSKSILKPLKLLFENCLRIGIFPDQWKKANIVSIHEKGDEQLLKNYRPISLLPICGNVFERMIFNDLFKYFKDNNPLSSHQSGFIPGDSCVQQLTAITHEIYKSFDCSPSLEVRGVFLDISKAFDKVWYDGLLCNLKLDGINGGLLKLIERFSLDRHQRVVLNGKTSKWNKITVGVPQGSILGPLFFLIYINELSCSPKLFANDTSLFSVIKNVNETAKKLNKNLENISKWAHQWKMPFNPDPTKMAKEVLFSRKKSKVIHPNLTFIGKDVHSSFFQKHLGLVLDSKLNFDMHLKETISIVNNGIALLKKLRYSIPRKPLLSIYKTFLRPHLDYCDVIYDKPRNEKFIDTLESIQYNATLAITVAIKGTSKEKFYNDLGLEYLRDRPWIRRRCLFHRISNLHSPKYLYDIIPPATRSYTTINNKNIPSFNAGQYIL